MNRTVLFQRDYGLDIELKISALSHTVLLKVIY